MGRIDMHDDVVNSFPEATSKTLRLPDVQASDCWKRAFADQCKNHRFYEIVERTLANEFEHRYLLLSRHRNPNP
jgi:hypothetical protein